MKKILFFSAILLISFGVLSSKTAKDVFESNEIVFCGIDFTHAKFFYPEGIKDKNDVINKHIPSINGLFLKEMKKYNPGKFFYKASIIYDLEVVAPGNLKIKPDEISGQVTNRLTEPMIQKLISSYNIQSKDGVGLVFIAEYMNKSTESGTFYVVFFDIASKNILFMENVSAAAGGFGFRNFWAKVFYNGMEHCEKIYPVWKEKYGK